MGGGLWLGAIWGEVGSRLRATMPPHSWGRSTTGLKESAHGLHYRAEHEPVVMLAQSCA